MNQPNYDEAKHPRGGDGKFATKPATEAQVSLVPTRPRSNPWTPSTDALAVDRIALMLADTDGSESTGDYLEDAANFIAATGRPHPGDADPDTYADDLIAWANEGPDRGTTGSSSKDTNAINSLALHLAETEDWSADEVEELGLTVTRAGRPEVNDEVRGPGGEEYQAALADWHQEQLVEHLRDQSGAATALIETMPAKEDASEDELIADASWVAARLATKRAPGLSVRFEPTELEEEGFEKYTVTYQPEDGEARSVTHSVDQLHDDTTASGPAAAAQYAKKFLADYERLRAKTQG